MKKIILSAFIIIVSVGFSNAQTATGSTQTKSRLGTRTETITSDLTQKLSLSPAQQDQVKTVFEQSLAQIQQVVETNNSDKHLANDQIQTLIQQREVALQNILTPQQLSLYHSSASK